MKVGRKMGRYEDRNKIYLHVSEYFYTKDQDLKTEEIRYDSQD